MLKKILFFLLFLVTLYNLPSPNSLAVELQSPRFKLDLDQLEVSTDKESEPVAYTIKTVYGSQKFNQFNSNGFAISYQAMDKPLEISLSNSLILISNSNRNQSQVLEVNGTGSVNQPFVISLVQEKPLENFYGDSLTLEYSIGKSGFFRTLPKYNTNISKIAALSTENSRTLDLNLRLKAPPQSIEGTYETTLNFISSPEF